MNTGFGVCSLLAWAVIALVQPVLVSAADLPGGLQNLKNTLTTKKLEPAKPKELEPTARLTSFTSWITSLAFSPDDTVLAVGVKDGVQLIDVESKEMKQSIDIKRGPVRSLAYSPDGKFLAAGSYQHASLFDAKTGSPVRELKGHRGFVTSIQFSPDGSRVATACEDEAVRIWNATNDDAPFVFKGHAGNPVTGVAWSPDGTLLATSAGDETRVTRPGSVKVWEAATGSVKQAFDLHGKAATGVAWSPDGKVLVSSSLDERVNVYDLKVGKALGFYAGHSRPTNAVVFYPDGDTILSVSGGRAVGKNELKIWEYDGAEELATADVHEGRITSLAVSHNGRIAATGGYDKLVALWNIGFLTVGLPESKPSSGKETASKVAAAKDVADAEKAVERQKALAFLNRAAALENGAGEAAAEPKPLRAGIIGLDTSHCIAFSKTLNANPQKPEVAGVRMVAVYPKGSPDIKSSVERVPGYTEEIKKLDIVLVDTIEELLKRVDFVFLETNDGRPHLEQYIPVAKSGKPCFIDKPIAGSLTDAVAIFEVAKKYNAPVFSSSSLRFGKNSQAARGGSLGKIKQARTTSPASLEPTHPDLFWYGIHGVESLFTVMGTGCQSVTRGKTADGKIEVIGKWSDDRTGTYAEGKGYEGQAVGERGEAAVGSFDGYDPLLFEIIKFARTGKPPVSEAETLEIYAFMEAADESKRQNGANVTIDSVMSKAKAEAEKKLAEIK